MYPQWLFDHHLQVIYFLNISIWEFFVFLPHFYLCLSHHSWILHQFCHCPFYYGGWCICSSGEEFLQVIDKKKVKKSKGRKHLIYDLLTKMLALMISLVISIGNSLSALRRRNTSCKSSSNGSFPVKVSRSFSCSWIMSSRILSTFLCNLANFLFDPKRESSSCSEGKTSPALKTPANAIASFAKLDKVSWSLHLRPTAALHECSFI